VGASSCRHLPQNYLLQLSRAMFKEAIAVRLLQEQHWARYRAPLRRPRAVERGVMWPRALRINKTMSFRSYRAKVATTLALVIATPGLVSCTRSVTRAPSELATSSISRPFTTDSLGIPGCARSDSGLDTAADSTEVDRVAAEPRASSVYRRTALREIKLTQHPLLAAMERAGVSRCDRSCVPPVQQRKGCLWTLGQQDSIKGVRHVAPARF
jgi:hypothetical protein